MKKRPITIIKTETPDPSQEKVDFPFYELEAIAETQNAERLFKRIHIKRCDSLKAAFIMSETFRRLYELAEAKRLELSSME